MFQLVFDIKLNNGIKSKRLYKVDCVKKLNSDCAVINIGLEVKEISWMDINGQLVGKVTNVKNGIYEIVLSQSKKFFYDTNEKKVTYSYNYEKIKGITTVFCEKK